MQNVLKQIFLMNLESILKDYSAYRTFKKNDAVINMRIPSEIMNKIKILATEQNVPYQTLIAATLAKLCEDDAKSI